MSKNVIIIALLFSIAGFSSPVLADGPVGASSGKGLNEQVTKLTKEILARGPKFSLAGKIETAGGGYKINGEKFTVNGKTQIFGTLKNGAVVQARGRIKKGKKIATHLVVSDIVKKNTEPAKEEKALKPDGVEELKSLSAMTQGLKKDPNVN